MSEVKGTAAQQALASLGPLGAKVSTAAKQAVGAAKGAVGITQAARQAQLQQTAEAGGRAAARGRQAGGWGMGSSMQALAGDLALSGKLGEQRAEFSQLEAEQRQAGAQAELDKAIFDEQRAMETMAAETNAINAINATMLNIMTQTPRDKWKATGVAMLAPYLSDAGTPVQGKIAALNNISRLLLEGGMNPEELSVEMAAHLQAVQAFHPEAVINVVQEPGTGAYTTFSLVS